MNTDNNGQQPITDDPELAQVLDGMNGNAANSAVSALQFEESPLPPSDGTTAAAADDTADNTAAVQPDPSTTAVIESTEEPAITIPEPVLPTIDTASFAPSVLPTPAANSELDSIKKDALEQLRPLVDRLNLPAEEKFDTLLLIIRSTDDQSLISAAHAAAKSIEDEAKRAQALLDVIKEIDYFSNQAK